MASQPEMPPQVDTPAGQDSVEMPRPTIAPLVLALGLALLAVGTALGLAFLVAGALVLVTGLSLWVTALLPGRGHAHEPLVEPALRQSPRPRSGRKSSSCGPACPVIGCGCPKQSNPSRQASRAASSAAW